MVHLRTSFCRYKIQTDDDEDKQKDERKEMKKEIELYVNGALGSLLWFQCLIFECKTEKGNKKNGRRT